MQHENVKAGDCRKSLRRLDALLAPSHSGLSFRQALAC
jgi:hypothetical protein